MSDFFILEINICGPPFKKKIFVLAHKHTKIKYYCIIYFYSNHETSNKTYCDYAIKSKQT